MAKRAKMNLTGMDFQSLMELREQVETALSGYRATIEKQLAAMGGAIATVVSGRGRRGSMKGRKVAPKYRGPGGETWAGRGATPKWLVEAVKGGKKRDDFLIDKAAGGGKAKRRTKK